MREVLARRSHGDERARLAFDVYVHRLRQCIAAMAVSVEPLDALVFTGGVGEHAAEVRDAVQRPSIPSLVVEAREDVEIARAVRSQVRS